MSNKYVMLFIIAVVTSIAVWIVLPNNPGLRLGNNYREIDTRLGLDLVGGVQALLEADIPEDVEVDPESLNTAIDIVSNRANGLLGVGEATVQRAGDRRIVVELPGETDPEQALATLGEIGQLEFVDLGAPSGSFVGQRIVTDFQLFEEVPEGTQVWPTVMTGDHLENVSVTRDPLNGEILVAFSLDDTGAEIFAQHTASNVGEVLAIVLDKVIISAPTINSAIPNGNGTISGNFTVETANELAIQLRYGSLPIPLRIAETRTVGPSLGQVSLERSLVAGLIGFGIVVLFMGLYYRLPGLIANVALVIYAVITFAIFKWVPVTLTLPGIAGFVLSVGVAVDANILIFERMKEELRNGKKLSTALEIGFRRAWPSIRDSNLSTLITCGILFWFGNNFGASIVKGFAVTLSIGVVVSLFTALTVTRTFLDLVISNLRIKNLNSWFGA